jgi:hypothetical protein
MVRVENAMQRSGSAAASQPERPIRRRVGPMVLKDRSSAYYRQRRVVFHPFSYSIVTAKVTVAAVAVLSEGQPACWYRLDLDGGADAWSFVDNERIDQA